MNNKIISGTKISEEIKENLKIKIEKISEKYGKIPTLAVVLVGNNSASEIYVKNKEKACAKCGIKSLKYVLSEDIKESELLQIIDKLNSNDNVNGILIQLPLPKHIDEKKVMHMINPKKDVDCFHVENVGKLAIGDFDYEKSMLPCTPKGCIKLIKSVLGDDLSGKNVCVLGRSNIVGKPIAQMLLNENCTVKITHSKTKNLKDECLWADILVVAVGKPKFLTADMVKKDAIIIDVGINRTDAGLCGDVDFDNVIDKVYAVTPVPGGVGPMTIACLMENTFNAFLEQNNNIRL